MVQVLASPPSGAVAPVTNYAPPPMTLFSPPNPAANQLSPVAPSSAATPNMYSDMPPLLMQSLIAAADGKAAVTSASDAYPVTSGFEYLPSQHMVPETPHQHQQQPQQQFRIPLPPISNISPLKAVKVEQISPPLPPATATYTNFTPAGASAGVGGLTSLWSAQHGDSATEGHAMMQSQTFDSVPPTDRHERIAELASEAQPTLASL